MILLSRWYGRRGDGVAGTAYTIPHLDALAASFVGTRRRFVSRPSRGHRMTVKALKSPVVDQIYHGVRRGDGRMGLAVLCNRMP